MGNTYLNYFTNLPRLLVKERLLRPLVVSYCVTAHCNLNCVYCEDFGARRNAAQPTPLTLLDSKHVLRLIRQATSSLIFTGGEPLLYPNFLELLVYARQTLKFSHVTMLTNALRLHEHMDVLPYLDRVMVSVDATSPAVWDRTIGAAPGSAASIIDNVLALSARQRADKFRVVINCVVTPDTLTQVEQVLDFCEQHDFLFSISPQSVNNWPHYELLVSADYVNFVERMLARKRQGAPILGSLAYLKILLHFEPYPCYPLLAPRVLFDGALAYPCRPIEREGDAHGGREANLLAVETWDAAVQRASAHYGTPPSTCGSCFQQCYIEPSLMQAKPLAFFAELLMHPASRQGRLLTYAPG